MVKRRRPAVKITGGGTGVVNHAGTRLLADLVDRLGLTTVMSSAMAPTKQRRRGHDRGDVLVDVAVMLADGGETISDVAVLRDQPDLFGEVASHPTVWRTLEAVDDDALAGIKAARAQARAKAWAAGADPGFYVVDIDATLVGSHSEKEQAAPTYKRGFGFHPLLAYLDATGEALAGVLRRGNAGSGTAADHVSVLDDALEQLPIDPAEVEVEVIARADTAGWSHGFVNRCRRRGVRFVIGHQLDVDVAKVLVKVPKRAWQPAVSADGGEWRDRAEVVKITHLVGDLLDGWPDGCRMIARRELAINHTWMHLVLTAHDLLAWTRLLALDGDLATAEPKRLRYCLLHTAGHLITTGRRRFCRLSDTWPWTDQLITAFTRVHALPLRI